MVISSTTYRVGEPPQNESSINRYCKTDAKTKTNISNSLRAVIDKQAKNQVVTSEAGENIEELGFLTNS